jgi:hypothetical protein
MVFERMAREGVSFIVDVEGTGVDPRLDAPFKEGLICSRAGAICLKSDSI